MTAVPQPHDLDAEEHVLGAMILSEQAIAACVELLEGHEFYRGSHGVLYRQIVEMWREGLHVDAVTVSDALTAAGTLADAGGRERIHEIDVLVPAAGNAGHKAKIVREAWAKRQLIDLFERGAEAAANGHTAAWVLDRLETRTLDIRGLVERGQRTTVATSVQLADSLEAEVADPPEALRGIPPPFRFQRPLIAGRLYVLAGYTAHGKTVLGTQYIRVACKAGHRVGVFSIEMTREQLYDRMVACFGVPLAQVEARRIEAVYQPSFERALAETRRWNVEINDDSDADSATFRRWQKLRRYDLLVIDHLHEIQVPGRAADRRVNLEAELTRIKAIAKDLDVPILLLAQLSRPAGTQSYPRPSLSMLKETGKIEQIAAQVVFIYRTVDDAGLPGTEAEIIVAKDRFGPTGKAPLRFDGECVRFTETHQETP